jgi:YidC/Oxa1 family membrane protein insertase
MNLWQALLHGLGDLLAFLYDLIPSYGVAIVLITVAVKLITLPLTIRQTRSMQGMQRLQPELKRLQAKHKGDRQKLNEEMMKLYQEHGVNPLGGCLPLLLQMPVFFALFRVFNDCGKVLENGRCAPGYVGTKFLPADSALREAIIAGQAGFLGMNLGTSPLQVFSGGEGIVAAVPYFLMVAFMTLTSWYQQKQMTAMQSTPQPAQTQMISRLMLFMFPLFSLNLPIALTVYWATNNLLTIGQQHLMLGKGDRGGGVLSRLVGLPGRSPAPGSAGERGSKEGSEKERAPAEKHKGSGARKGRQRR